MRWMKGCESWRYLFLGIFLGLNILELGDRMKGICLNMFELHLFTSFGSIEMAQISGEVEIIQLFQP